MESTMQWSMDVPLFNALVLKQLGIAIGIPFGILLIFLISIEATYGVLLVAITLVTTALLVWILYGGKTSIVYQMDSYGIRQFPSKKEQNKNKQLNRLTILAGILARNPTVAGSGLLAQSNQERSMAWSQVKAIRVLKQDALKLEGSIAQSMVVFCPKEQFPEIKAFIEQRVGELV